MQKTDTSLFQNLYGKAQALNNVKQILKSKMGEINVIDIKP